MNFKQFCMTTLAVVAGIFITGVLSMFGMIYMMLQMILLNLGKEHQYLIVHPAQQYTRR